MMTAMAAPVPAERLASWEDLRRPPAATRTPPASVALVGALALRGGVAVLAA